MKRGMRSGLSTAGVLMCLTGLLAGCQQFSLYGDFKPLSGSTVAVGPLTISPGVAGVFAGRTVVFSAKGGSPPYSFGVLSGGAGGSVSSSGVYTAPTTVASSPSDVATVQVTDSAGQISNATVTVVTPLTLTISPAALTLASPDSYTFTASGGVPPYTFSPSGGTVNGSTYTYTFPSGVTSQSVTVSDNAGDSASSNITAATSSLAVSPTLSSAPTSVSATTPQVAIDQSITLVASGGSGTYTATAISGTTTVNGSYITYTPAKLGSSGITVTSGSSSVTGYIAVTPDTPSGVTATAASSSEVDLSWTYGGASSTISGFNVERETGNSGTFSLIATVSLPTTGSAPYQLSYADTSVSPGTVYVYQIVATGTGSPKTTASSSEVIATTPN